MFKKFSISGISLLVTLCVAVTNGIWLSFIYLNTPSHLSLVVLVLSVLFVSFVCYFFIKFLLDKFVLQRVRLVYKMIGSTKSVKEDSKQNILTSTTNLEELDKEVSAWTKDKEEEISNLKSLEAYRRNYLGNVSHELKTPIFSIQGYLHTLIEGGLYDTSINEKYLLRASANAERLENIVKDLEAINKLESDPALTLVKFDVKELVKEVFNELDILAKENNIELKIGKGKEFQVVALADKNKISQVFSNLISNAIKYSNAESEITVDFYNIEDRFLIEVSDTGEGIEEEHLKHLFDRFYRVDASRSRSVGGSGLGLSIVKHIVEVHNETINVRSTVGEGTTFAFTLRKS